MQIEISAAGAAMPSGAEIKLGTGEPADPVLPLYSEWVAARIEWHRYANVQGNGNWDMPESKAAEKREHDALLAMLDTTPASAAGIAALASVLWDFEGPAVSPEHEDFAEACDTPTRKLIRAIWRAASGQDELSPDGRMEGAV